MSKEPQRQSLAARALAAALGLSITLAGCSMAEGEQTAPPSAPTATAPAATVPATDEPTAADLWSDDRSRIDTPLLSSADLESETQWAIFTKVCGQNPSPIKTDNITLSIDNVVLDLHISNPAARDELMHLLGNLPITHAVEVTHWDSFRIGSFREQFSIQFQNGPSVP